MELVAHGYDPDVHREIQPSESLRLTYGCDSSFVGCWSERKDRYLSCLIRHLPAVKPAIWGPAWERASSRVRPFCVDCGAYGDELAAIYACSRVNLGLLSEAGKDTSSGDLTTARTWQIPACGGFLLHEDTEELRRSFEPDIEVGVFRGESDIALRVQYWHEHPEHRESARRAGLARSQASSYSYGGAAEAMLVVARS